MFASLSSLLRKPPHFIDYKLTEEVLKMAGKYSSYRKNLERMAEDIGKDILPFLSAEERVRGLTPEDLVRVLTPEERKKLKQLLEEEDEKNQR
jgi:rubrerythrin